MQHQISVEHVPCLQSLGCAVGVCGQGPRNTQVASEGEQSTKGPGGRLKPSKSRPELTYRSDSRKPVDETGSRTASSVSDVRARRHRSFSNRIREKSDLHVQRGRPHPGHRLFGSATSRSRAADATPPDATRNPDVREQATDRGSAPDAST